MELLLLPIIAKLLPYIIMAIGLMGVYFHVKHKGELQERTKWQAEQDKLTHKEIEAQSKDSSIDKSVSEKIEALKQNPPGTNGKFHF